MTNLSWLLNVSSHANRNVMNVPVGGFIPVGVA
jgi:hypothetical protein